MSNAVKIVECPRDAWQGLTVQIAPQQKVDYLRKLISAGFTHIDAVSFVSPAAVPQMADSEQVLELLGPQKGIEIIAIIVNEKGAERAIRTGAVHTLGFPYSISPEFLRRNQHQTPEQSHTTLRAVVASARDAGLGIDAYLSMAFGNPYGEVWNIRAVLNACDQMISCGVQQISLADTVGVADPVRISETLAAVLAAHPEIEVGAHLHARRDHAAARIRAAYNAGCRRFDSAVGGLGGCPFAEDVLVGNLPTELLITALTECGAKLPKLGPMEELTDANAEIASTYGVPVP
jgi:hydroxymethylglutaryl-CoA lyase